MAHTIRVQCHQPQVCDDVNRALETLCTISGVSRLVSRGLYNATRCGHLVSFDINPSHSEVQAAMQVNALRSAGWLCELIETPESVSNG